MNFWLFSPRSRRFHEEIAQYRVAVVRRHRRGGRGKRHPPSNRAQGANGASLRRSSCCRGCRPLGRDQRQARLQPSTRAPEAGREAELHTQEVQASLRRLARKSCQAKPLLPASRPPRQKGPSCLCPCPCYQNPCRHNPCLSAAACTCRRPCSDTWQQCALCLRCCHTGRRCLCPLPAGRCKPVKGALSRGALEYSWLPFAAFETVKVVLVAVRLQTRQALPGICQSPVPRVLGSCWGRPGRGAAL